MAEFYVETKPQSNGDHLIHKSDCTLLPSNENTKYIGSLAHCRSAVTYAKEMFRQVNGCTQCCSPCHTS